MIYIHERQGWPSCHWDADVLVPLLADVRHQQGRLIGRMESLGFGLRDEAVLRTLTDDVVKSSEIEGEILDRDQVRSSIARRLGLDIGGLMAVDRDVDGFVDMMLDATQAYDEPLTDERLFVWQAALFPAGRSGMHRIRVGAWRDDRTGPMQVTSGPIGRERVHFQAPAAGRVAQEMRTFLAWFNDTQTIDPVLKAGIAHLWFVTIHPFDDGNGRIARAIADMQLARSERSPRRFYSMSAQIRQDRKGYYAILEATQKRDLDITAWLQWFIACLGRAVEGAESVLGSILRKAHFWSMYSSDQLNARQRNMLNRLLDGFTGKLTSSKWAAIEKCSTDTALRDIADLQQRGILVRDEGGGRSTSYSLVVGAG